MLCAVCQSEATTLTRGLCPSCAGVTVTAHAEPREEDPFWAKGSDRGKVKRRGKLYKAAKDLATTSTDVDELRRMARRMPRSGQGDALRARLNKRAGELEGE